MPATFYPLQHGVEKFFNFFLCHHGKFGKKVVFGI
jgi:hypothetical protein